MIILFSCSANKSKNDSLDNNIEESNKAIDNKSFTNSKSPLIIWVAITGNPTKTEIQEHLSNLKTVGIDQFIIYPRSGLELEFMSEKFLDVCENIIEYAAKNDMSVWLYDEYNWPSGKCGGQVVKQNKDFACKKITVWADEHPTGKVIDNVRMKHDYYWTVSSIPIYADLLNPKAVESFISLTYEKYFDRFEQYFGNVIKGVFSDEPSFSYAVNHTTRGSLLELSYYEGLEEDYYEFTNRKFRNDVEAHLHGLTPPDLWKDYFYLLGRRFRSSYFDQIRTWCEEHNVLLTGHLLSEGNPYGTLKTSGNPMSVIKSFSLPGIDEISTKTSLESLEWVTMGMIENAVWEKGSGALAELFALGPSDMPLGKMRQMIWITSLHGVNHFLLSIAALDLRGNIQKNWYMTFNPTQPWFEGLNELREDAKKASIYASKETEHKIAVRYPQTLTASTFFDNEEDKPSVQLSELLMNLYNWQWNPILIEENNENTSVFEVILSINKTGIIEENSGKFFDTFNELSNWLEENIQRNAVVEDINGDMANNILVKSFKDGSVCVVSLLNKPQGELHLKVNKKETCLFEMPEYGVFTYEPGQLSPAEKNELEIFTDELLEYSLTSPNSMRVIFDKFGKCEFVLDEAFDDLTIAARKYGEKVSLFGDTVRLELDGEEVRIDQPCKLLPKEFRKLYMESGQFSLEKGVHTLSLISDNSDYHYLPSAFLFGNFALNQNNQISKLPNTLSIGLFKNQGLLNYSGGIMFNKNVKINNEECISIDTGGLVTELFINNEFLGRKAWAPFLWEIPQEYRNKTVDLRILIKTSIEPIFGMKTSNKSVWDQP